jgi:hypothetical protein
MVSRTGDEDVHAPVQDWEARQDQDQDQDPDGSHVWAGGGELHRSGG